MLFWRSGRSFTQCWVYTYDHRVHSQSDGVLPCGRRILERHAAAAGPNDGGAIRVAPADRGRDQAVIQETIIPSQASRRWFLIAPMLTFALALVAWAVIPIDAGLALANINVGILYLFAISSMGVYGIIMAGWASNSKYAFLGGMRSASQMVSYEVSWGL